MLARIHAAPNTADVVAALQVVADALYAINVAWLERIVGRGLAPPTSLLRCEPPWCAKPIVYVTHRGAPIGTTRDYYDGPIAMHRGSATCIEIASYDAAASSVLLSNPARPLVVGQLPSLHCVVRYSDGATLDPTSEVQAWRSLL